MAYFDKLTSEEQKKYLEVVSFTNFISSEITKFVKDNSFRDSSNQTLEIKNKVFKHNADVIGEIPCGLRFEDCYFNGDVNFRYLTIKGDVIFSQCACDGEIYVFENSVFEKDFDIIGMVVRRQLYVKGGKFDVCRWAIDNNSNITIAGGEYKELNIGYWSGATISNLTLDLNPKMSGLIRVTGSKSRIERFQIFKSTAEISISIEDISVNLLSIFRYRNDANFRLTNLKPLSDEKLSPSEFSIVESYMGKAELYNINFKKFDVVNIHNSHISDCSLVNIMWPSIITSFKGSGISLTDAEKALPEKISNFEKEVDKEKLIDDPEINEYYQINREVYRQLKYIYHKQGDSVNGHRFHAKEMLAFKNTITLERHFLTKVVIYFSHWFSGFGRSIGRPLFALLSFHFLLMILLIWSGGIDNLEINLSKPSWNGFKIGFEKYFKYINPLRKYDDDFTGYYIIFDVLMRIWSSYMIYNIVRASRRFIK